MISTFVTWHPTKEKAHEGNASEIYFSFRILSVQNFTMEVHPLSLLLLIAGVAGYSYDNHPNPLPSYSPQSYNPMPSAGSGYYHHPPRQYAPPQAVVYQAPAPTMTTFTIHTFQVPAPSQKLGKGPGSSYGKPNGASYGGASLGSLNSVLASMGKDNSGSSNGGVASYARPPPPPPSLYRK